MLSPLRTSTDAAGFARYDVQTLTDLHEELTIRWYDPLDVVNGLVFDQKKFETSFAARQRGKKKPYVVHLSWIGQVQKIPTFRAHDLWYLKDGQCSETPNGAAMADWQ
jgi:hypothetical protein